tara:strand:+ start:12919 stop:13095 length:177 start_codon:yes stop_codon:yes gene_type:complete
MLENLAVPAALLGQNRHSVVISKVEGIITPDGRETTHIVNAIAAICFYLESNGSTLYT